jgi:pimeloyl-ACP methyl ester carboxylesterase
MTKNSSQTNELRLPGAGIELGACQWNADQKQSFVALHGWLDNAASMEPLAKQLSQLQIVAPDLAGHGRSNFRSADSNYDLVTDVADISALTNNLAWDKFGLIGHSRGAMIAALYAATFPEQITHLILIDGGAPREFDSSERPAKLARAIREQAIHLNRQGSRFNTREAALKARSSGFVPVDHAIAELLATRSLVSEDGSHYWRADQRLKAGSVNPLDKETMRGFFAAIQCPVLQIVGEQGLLHEYQDYAGPIDLIKDFERVSLPGDHHLHIGQVDSVSSAINAWLESKSG